MIHQMKMFLVRNPYGMSHCLLTGRIGDPPRDQQKLPNSLQHQNDKLAAVNSSSEHSRVFLKLNRWQQWNKNLSLIHINDCETFLYYGVAKAAELQREIQWDIENGINE